ncbi:hypothetical protein BDV37DRAFT_292201 [Aspergillus pseudonomiae]|uniref:Uncharacterized protein n=1 Tax=Aspergillus pseudonomiae TaxID=1506151 RepID=A0A5N7CSU2_9EURO|nr:uncharacterized protein BDV37DRAFT_292201 [Aspergillus pseudonomiae]KAE8397310.1 hypothetical protein BDV37DRAFT_292201 [Aspergillus pseudonomiae]
MRETALHIPRIARSPGLSQAIWCCSSTNSTTQTYILPFSLGQAISSSVSLLPEPSPPVTDTKKALLISSYLRKTGTRCETTNTQRQSTAQNIHGMMEPATFVAAAMSLASRQLDHIEQCQHSVTLELYQYTIRLLLGQDPTMADASVLATCTLLCLFALIPTDFWMDNMSIVPAAADGDIDNYCNLAIIVFAKIKSSGNLRRSMAAPWNELQEWYRLRPKQVYPLLRSECTPSNTLSNIVFTQSSSARYFTDVCGNTFYHASSILLLQEGLIITAHVREQMGISISNVSHTNGVYQLQPLYIAGTVLAGFQSCYTQQSGWSYVWSEVRPGLSSSNSPGDQNSRSACSVEEFAAEKILLLKNLGLIERETG